MKLARSATVAMMMMLPATVCADEVPTLADLGRDTALTEAFQAMSAGVALPDWLRDGMVTTPTLGARFDGRDWMVMSGCKPHDCAAQQIAVIWSPQSRAMHGLLSETAEDGEAQNLRWLNIGGGAESIDGRTVLFAALSGSLANHPAAFSYD